MFWFWNRQMALHSFHYVLYVYLNILHKFSFICWIFYNKHIFKASNSSFFFLLEILLFLNRNISIVIEKTSVQTISGVWRVKEKIPEATTQPTVNYPRQGLPPHSPPQLPPACSLHWSWTDLFKRHVWLCHPLASHILIVAHQSQDKDQRPTKLNTGCLQPHLLSSPTLHAPYPPSLHLVMLLERLFAQPEYSVPPTCTRTCQGHSVSFVFGKYLGVWDRCMG